MMRRPSRIEPIPGVPDVIDYPRDIQPILDKHCVECHRPERREGKVDLTGDRTVGYSMAYWTMQTRSLVSDGRNRDFSNYDPYLIGMISIPAGFPAMAQPVSVCHQWSMTGMPRLFSAQWSVSGSRRSPARKRALKFDRS